MTPFFDLARSSKKCGEVDGQEDKKPTSKPTAKIETVNKIHKTTTREKKKWADPKLDADNNNNNKKASRKEKGIRKYEKKIAEGPVAVGWFESMIQSRFCRGQLRPPSSHPLHFILTSTISEFALFRE